jgi:hypothetical protein
MNKKENLIKYTKSNPAKKYHDQALVRLHQLTFQLHDATRGENQAQTKPGTTIPIHKSESIDYFKPTNRRKPNTRGRVSPLKQKSLKHLKMPQSMRGVVDSAREAVNAVIAVAVPGSGHEAAVWRRKDRARRRLSLNDSFITLLISSGIMAAILSA